MPFPQPRPVPARVFVSIHLTDVGDADGATVAALAVNHLLDQRPGEGWEGLDDACELRFHTADQRPMAAPVLQPGVRSLGAFDGTPVALWLSQGFPLYAGHPDHIDLE